jgi:hypothetical protein
MSTHEAIDLALQVHATYFRNTAFLLTPGAYQHDPGVVRAAGFEQILNVHYVVEPTNGPPGPSSFPRDLADYKARVARATDDVRPVLIVVENEASYDGHFSVPPSSTLLVGAHQLTARNYLERTMGRRVIVGEWGIRSEDPAVMSRLMDVLSQRDYAQLWSKDTGDGTQSLFAPNGKLRAIGEAFRDFITVHYML